jgi:hypothetical protein
MHTVRIEVEVPVDDLSRDLILRPWSSVRQDIVDAFLLGVDKIAFCRRSTRDAGTSCGPMGSASPGCYTNEYRLLAAVLLYFAILGDVPGALGSSRMFD